MMQGKYRIIRDAIQDRRPLLARHRTVWLTLSPYALGWCGEHPQLLAYADGDPPAWLSLRAAELFSVRLADGPWLAAPAVPADMEMDVVDVVAPVQLRMRHNGSGDE